MRGPSRASLASPRLESGNIRRKDFAVTPPGSQRRESSTLASLSVGLLQAINPLFLACISPELAVSTDHEVGVLCPCLYAIWLSVAPLSGPCLRTVVPGFLKSQPGTHICLEALTPSIFSHTEPLPIHYLSVHSPLQEILYLRAGADPIRVSSSHLAVRTSQSARSLTTSCVVQ